MIRIIYVSKASSPLPIELKDILALSRANNARLGITGAMCLINGIYFQLLEGEEFDVRGLYARIEQDPRHSEPKLLDISTIENRAFEKWAMGLLTWNAQTQDIFQRFNPEHPNEAYMADPATINAMFQAWTASDNWLST